MEIHDDITLAKHSGVVHLHQFWKAVEIWHDNPQFVNRRLSGTTVVFSGQVQQVHDTRQLYNIVSGAGITYPMKKIELLNALKKCEIYVIEKLPFACDDCKIGLFITFKKLLPRNCHIFHPVLELTIIDKVKNEVIFVNLQSVESGGDLSVSPLFPYSLKFSNGEICLSTWADKVADKSVAWLLQHLLPKIGRWAETSNGKESLKSLTNVSVEQYTYLYQKLKEKYGQRMVEMWPENTDPRKFVYEDVAIATFLLLLWEDQRNKMGKPDWKQSFVDLGCGNGLLVYILNGEGHPGFGIDVRKRRIWDLYPEPTELRVQTFSPCEASLFPETDWIIGNHSDELTPWIPIIAARSSYQSSFFLLPCCPYDFSGSRYKRQDASKSQYSEYLNYVKNICCRSGFIVKLDRLRIPSTKRICLFAMDRLYSENDFNSVNEELLQYVRLRCDDTSVMNFCTRVPDSEQNKASCDGGWVCDFKPRENKEKVQNCTKLNQIVVKTIVELVANILLSTNNTITVPTLNGQEKSWNEGGTVSLQDIAKVVPNQLLKQLRRECGGLQTLLKNNHHVFSVLGGHVKFANPTKKDLEKKAHPHKFRRKVETYKYKQKTCWFYNSHPNGCPLNDSECSYQH